MKTKPIPVRISIDQLAEVRKFAAELRISDMDAIRLAIRIGLVTAERLGYDIVTTIVDQVVSRPEDLAERRRQEAVTAIIPARVERAEQFSAGLRSKLSGGQKAEGESNRKPLQK